jgi:hypothetical protein
MEELILSLCRERNPKKQSKESTEKATGGSENFY